METQLSIPEIERLVAEEARSIDQAITADRVHVYERSESPNNDTIVIQIKTKRPAGQKEWTRSRLRLSQSIRDILLKSGDDRYPLVEIFAPEEWEKRND